MGLRPYQEKGIQEIRALYQQGVKRVMLHLATGGGKTVVFSHTMKECAARGMEAIMVVRGRELVEQASQRLFREKVEHGVRMAGHWNRNYGARVQVCSIDTLIARQDFPKAKLVVIDEADQATSEGYRKLAEHYSDSFFLPVTATPYVNKSLRHIADAIVHPVSIQELIDQGYLVPPRYYAPSAPDLDGINIVNNDYQSSQLESRMGALTGDIVAHWQKLGEGRPTVCFAVNVHHSHTLRDLFISKGIEAEHCDADTPDFCRKAILKRLESGQTKVVCNVGILCRGVDMPFLGCVIMARPTRSYNLYIQQAGRGTRPCDGKRDFILLDHAGNVPRHGFITVEPPADLDGNKSKKKFETGVGVKICKQCYLAFQGFHCPDCGPTAETTREEIQVQEGQLQEIVVGEEDPVIQYIAHCKQLAKRRQYKSAWVWHQLIKRFGTDVAAPYLPSWFVQHHEENPFFGSPFRGLHGG